MRMFSSSKDSCCVAQLIDLLSPLQDIFSVGVAAKQGGLHAFQEEPALLAEHEAA